MKSYKTKLTLRLVWWWTWWAVCAFMFFGNLLEFILAIFSDVFFSYQSSVIYIIEKVVALGIFVIPTLGFFPSIDKLLSKDLKDEKAHLYAKSIILERSLRKKNKADEKRKKDEQLERTVKAMEQQLADDDHERDP